MQKKSLYPILLVALIIILAACDTRALAPTASSSAAPTQIPPTLAPPATSAQASTQVPTQIPPTVAPLTTPVSSAPTLPAPTVAPTLPAPTLTRATVINQNFSIGAAPYLADLTKPVFVTHANDGSGRLFIVEQGGRILVAENGRVRAAPFLNLRKKINTDGSERGLLSMAFHPDYQNNGIFFVDYTAKPDGATVIERYQVSSDPNVADETSGRVILTFEQPEENHNGGMLAFGPDGYLYIGSGDGGGGGDRHGPIGNGQNLNTLLGKILRIDVNADTYTIPATNPFVGRADARPEIWAYGLRNPWRFSFDRATGDLYIGDVGQGDFEEIDFQPASSSGGENYGWRLMEGKHCFNPSQNCDDGTLVQPIAEYSHDFGCSVTGGYVYRGQKYAWLDGQYLFADYCTGIVWATARDADGAWHTRRVGTFDDTISSFGEDETGEMYIVGHGGAVYTLTASQQ